MERGSDKHSARQDDALAHEVQGMMQAGRATHAEEWKDAEPSGEDQPDVDRAPDRDLMGGVPAGMTHDDVEGRSELARHLTRHAFPGNRDQLVEAAREDQAPARVVEQLEGLPAGQEFVNVEEVWIALGGGTETQRF